MNRKEFLTKLSISALPVLVGISPYLQSCKKEDEAACNQPTSAVDFTIDLNDDTYNALKNNGGFVYKDAVIIARTSSGNFIAVSQTCTHTGCTVKFDASNNFPCPCHGSKFDSNGNVIIGPAECPLRKYTTSLNLNGNLLRVFS